MDNLTYEQLVFFADYPSFILAPKRFRSFRLHLGEEEIADKDGGIHLFDLVWFKGTEELIAVEVEESLGWILPSNFRLKRNTERYLFLGSFTEKGIDDLVVYKGKIISYLRELVYRGRRQYRMVTEFEFKVGEPRKFLAYCPTHHSLVIGTDPPGCSTGLPIHSCGCVGFSWGDNENPFEISEPSEIVQATLDLLSGVLMRTSSEEV